MPHPDLDAKECFVFRAPRDEPAAGRRGVKSERRAGPLSPHTIFFKTLILILRIFFYVGMRAGQAAIWLARPE